MKAQHSGTQESNAMALAKAPAGSSQLVGQRSAVGRTAGSLVGFRDAGLLERIETVRQGVTVAEANSVARLLGTSKEHFYALLKIPVSSVTRKDREGKRMSVNESERVLAIADLIALAEQIVTESGDPTGFDVGAWVAQWIETPNPALNGALPSSYLDTSYGRQAVQNLLAQMQSGVFA